MTKELLREYIRETLLIEAGGDGAMVYNGGYGGYLQYGSAEDLTNAFIKPFTDVLKTTAGKTKEMSVDVQSLIKTALHAVVTSIIPGIKFKFDEIYEKRSKQLDSIRAQYKEVYDANWDALKHEDSVLFAFLYNPVPVVMGVGAKKTVGATLNVIDIISGGWVTAAKEKFSKKSNKSSKKSILRENNSPLDSEGFVKAAFQTPKAKRLIKTVREIVNENIEKTLELFFKYHEVETIDDIEKAIGKELDPKVITDELRSNEAIVKQLLASYKLGIKNQILTGIDKHIAKIVGGGIPEISEYVVAYKNLRNEISEA